MHISRNSTALRHWFLAGAASLSLLAAQAQAHFIWIVPQTGESGGEVQLYFAEDAAPDDPDLLTRIEGMQVWALSADGQPTALYVQRTEDNLFAGLTPTQLEKCLIVGSHDLGVLTRGQNTFRLTYHAKTGPVLGSAAWKQIDCSRQLQLDIVPEAVAEGVKLHVRFAGKPVAGDEVKASGPGLDEFVGETDAQGTAVIPLTKDGTFSIRVRHIDATAGELDGKSYPETRHYSTLTLNVQRDASQVVRQNLQPLEQPVTSFGGAILGDKVFIYGGHTGGAHSYANDEQDRFVRQLDLKTGVWKSLAEGPPLQGLALVAHGDRLYRIGGFTAKNAAGEKHDLWSQADVAAFDLKVGAWVALPSLPEARSSFDAAVLDGKIYVIGGWAMAGEKEAVWHETAWVLDVTAAKPEWKAVPNPPFQRRALAVAAHQGKIYAIGGMQSEGGPTTRVDIFDPQTQTWSRGADLAVGDVQQDQKESTEENRREQRAAERRRQQSGGMTGFGASAFATGGHLYCTTIKGDLQRLAEDGSKWEILRQTPTARFFHRMLPVNDHQLLMIGGASMEVGKFDEVEILDVSP